MLKTYGGHILNTRMKRWFQASLLRRMWIESLSFEYHNKLKMKLCGFQNLLVFFLLKIANHAQNLYYFNNDGVQIWQKLQSSKIHYCLNVMLRRFTRGIFPTQERIQSFTNLVDISCPLCFIGLENEIHLMVHCEVSRVLGFSLLGLHLQRLSFNNLIEFLVAILSVNSKLSYSIGD